MGDLVLSLPGYMLPSQTINRKEYIIPSYVVPGVSKNKSIYMSDLLGTEKINFYAIFM